MFPKVRVQILLVFFFDVFSSVRKSGNFLFMLIQLSITLIFIAVLSLVLGRVYKSVKVYVLKVFILS